MIHSNITPAEALAALHLAGGQLRAEPTGELFVDGLAPDHLHPATLATLRAHKAMLHRYATALGGAWPAWKELPMK